MKLFVKTCRKTIDKIGNLLRFDKSFTRFFVCTAKKRRRSQTVFAKQKCFDHENRGVLGQSPEVLVR